MANADVYKIDFFNVTFPAEYVAHVEINRPAKLNAFGEQMFYNLCATFDKLSRDSNVRCILLSGAGKAFTAGLDVEEAATSGPISRSDSQADTARKAWAVRRFIVDWQNCVNSLERCEKPIIVLMHGYAFGAALDISTAGDIRYCTEDVKFSVKEVDIGIAADVGVLSRLPKIGVPYSWVKEVVYTAKVFGSEEAAKVGLVTKVLKDKQELLEQGLELAKLIASKSPVAVQGSKALLDYSRDRPIEDGLKYTQAWNAAMVICKDVEDATLSGIRKTKPKFAKL